MGGAIRRAANSSMPTSSSHEAQSPHRTNVEDESGPGVNTAKAGVERSCLGWRLRTSPVMPAGRPTRLGVMGHRLRARASAGRVLGQEAVWAPTRLSQCARSAGQSLAELSWPSSWTSVAPSLLVARRLSCRASVRARARRACFGVALLAPTPGCSVGRRRRSRSVTTTIISRRGDEGPTSADSRLDVGCSQAGAVGTRLRLALRQFGSRSPGLEARSPSRPGRRADFLERAWRLR